VKKVVDEVKNRKPIDAAHQAYVGSWTGSDGSTLTIRSDGSGDVRSGGVTVTNGTVIFNDDTLEVKLAGIGKKFRVTQPPSSGHMQLDGVQYDSGGGGASTGGTSTGGAPGSGNSGGNSSGGTSGSAPAADGKPDQAGANQIAKATLVLFKNAVDTEDFQAFYDASASNLHSEHTPETIKNAFKVFLDNKALLEPIGSMEPSVETINITSDGHLELVGSYPSSPALKFELVYFSEDGVWKIAGIKVNRTA
jgi:hypothetical protein